MTQNFNSPQPEWFKLVDSDAPSAQVKKVDKKLPAIAAVVAGAIIAAGGLFANASGENQVVSQILESSASTATSTSTTADSIATKSSQSTSPILKNVNNSAIATAAPVAPNQGGRQDPSTGGMSAPTGGNDDDDDDDDDDEREGHGDRDRH